jgi:phosphoenolpyruvate synthase/pyruvate phosphate dikinase
LKHILCSRGRQPHRARCWRQAGIREEIRSILADLDVTDLTNLEERGDKVRR